MAMYYLGQIIMFSGPFIPIKFVECAGQRLKIADYTDLFALIGNIYGGDGVTSFAVPDLRMRVPISSGTGVAAPGGEGSLSLTKRDVGSTGGQSGVALTAQTIPKHTHALNATNVPATDNNPAGKMLAVVPNDTAFYLNDTPGGVKPITAPLAFDSVSQVGSASAHNNIMPSLSLRFIMCTSGMYPSFPS